MSRKRDRRIADIEPEELTPEDLSLFKERLIAKRQEVKQRLTRHLSQAITDDDRSADELDQAGKISDQAYLMRLADKERKLLQQIEHALRKFETDEYGLCEGTGELIGRKRLDLRPWTRYSIEHKERLERQKGR